jgi:DNA repair protein RecO (recombination protein O)
MRVLEDDAYVLRTWPLGDADLIVMLFAAAHGRVRGVARSARQSRRRFGGLLEPLTRVRLGWTEKDGRELHRIDALDGQHSYAAMQADPALQAACAVLAEMTEAFTHEGEPDRKSFDLLGAVLGAFEGGLDPWIGVRYFEYWLLRLHGLLPELERCVDCTRPTTGAAARVVPGAGALCDACAQAGEPAATGVAVRLSSREIAFLAAARASRPETLSGWSDAVRPGGGLDAFFRASLEGFVERPFRAYRHLRAQTRSPA